jgi:hypothetical protein
MFLDKALPLMSSALEALSVFKGSASMARTTDYVQSAINVVSALTPLLQQFSVGAEVNESDVERAITGLDSDIAVLDALITSKKS